MWLKKAFKNPQQDPCTYYVAIDPVLFYEYKFANKIPKGSLLSKQMPPISVLDNQVIASVNIHPSMVKVSNKGYETSEDTECELSFVVGQAQSPMDILDKYNSEKKLLTDKFDEFKQAAMINKFVISSGEVPRLYEIKQSRGQEVYVKDFGTIKDVLSQFKISSLKLQKDSLRKKGRAYELTNATKMNKVFSMMTNKMPIDSSEMDFMITVSEIQPVHEKILPWSDLFYSVDLPAKAIYEKMAKFESLQWVKATQQYLLGVSNVQKRTSQSGNKFRLSRLS
jgi:hypothetical protein